MEEIKFVARETVTKVLESSIQTPAMKWLKSQPDIRCWKASDMYTRGVSDIIICLSGLFVAIELKVPGKIPTPLQHGFIEDINRVNGIAFYCDSVEGVKNAIEYLRKEYFGLIGEIYMARQSIKVTNDRLVTK